MMYARTQILQLWVLALWIPSTFAPDDEVYFSEQELKSKKEVVCPDPKETCPSFPCPNDPKERWNKENQVEVDAVVREWYPNSLATGHSIAGQGMLKILNGYTPEFFNMYPSRRGVKWTGMYRCFKAQERCWKRFAKIVQDVACQFYMQNYVAEKSDEFTIKVRKALVKLYDVTSY